jgi:hypothetical protein
MIILEESNTSQSFKCVPRYYVADTMTLKSETTGEVFTYSIDPVVDGYHLEITDTFDCVEGHFYTLKIYDEGNVVYRDRVFCTNQTIEAYTVNENEYTTLSSNNDFIIIS